MIQGLQLGMDKVRQISYQLSKYLFINKLQENNVQSGVQNRTELSGCELGYLKMMFHINIVRINLTVMI